MTYEQQLVGLLDAFRILRLLRAEECGALWSRGGEQLDDEQVKKRMFVSSVLFRASQHILEQVGNAQITTGVPSSVNPLFLGEV